MLMILHSCCLFFQGFFVADNEIRLNHFLAQCGVGSRRTCETYITDGKVQVNGLVVTQLGTKVDPVKDVVKYDWKRVKPVKTMEYIAYHKSRGSMVTLRDPEGRLTIYDALKKNGYVADHLKYVGRLDQNSEGLLLLTNDGDKVYELTHPKFQVKKVYHVTITSRLASDHAQQMVKDGVKSDGEILRAGAIWTLPKLSKETEFWYELDLYEGKNRHIRRMFEGLGYEIERLIRTQYGVVKLGNLKRGEFRRLTEQEIKALKVYAHPLAKTAITYQ
jgi:23S rRNA pseudouridine2605 synthase